MDKEVNHEFKNPREKERETEIESHSVSDSASQGLLFPFWSCLAAVCVWMRVVVCTI